MDTKSLKYKYLYSGQLTIRELLQLVQEADVPVGNMAIIDIVTYLDKLEAENIALKMAASELQDTGHPVLPMSTLPDDFKEVLRRGLENGELYLS